MRSALVLFALMFLPVSAFAQQAAEVSMEPAKPFFEEGESLQFRFSNVKAGETRTLEIQFFAFEQNGTELMLFDDIGYEVPRQSIRVLRLEPINENWMVLPPGTYVAKASGRVYQKPGYKDPKYIDLQSEFRVVRRTMGVLLRTGKVRYTAGDDVKVILINSSRKTWYQMKDSRSIQWVSDYPSADERAKLPVGNRERALHPKTHQSWIWSSKDAEVGPYLAQVMLYSDKVETRGSYFMLRKKFELVK